MKHQKLSHYAIVALLPLLVFMQTAKGQNMPSSYAEEMKNAKDLKTVGASCLAAGTGLVLWAVLEAPSWDYYWDNLGNPNAKESFDWKGTAGAVLIGTGAITLTLGILKSSQVKKMIGAGQGSLQPHAPPARIAGTAHIPQRGLTFSVPIGK